MKKLLIILSCFFSVACFAQAPTSFIKPNLLDITSNKTSNIIFPYAVLHVDKGSTDILAQKVNGAPNVLEVKAAKDSFTETNLSVITADGKLYSFIVHYAAQPVILNTVIEKQYKVPAPAQTANNARVLQETSKKLLVFEKSLNGINDKHDRMHLRLIGLYVQHDVFYFQFQFYNKSNVSYDIDGTRFTILDKRKSKRTARQENELQALYSEREQQSVSAGNKLAMVVALPKFTLPDGKYLFIHITEKGGGRDLRMKLGNRTLLRAISIDK